MEEKPHNSIHDLIDTSSIQSKDNLVETSIDLDDDNEDDFFDDFFDS